MAISSRTVSLLLCAAIALAAEPPPTPADPAVAAARSALAAAPDPVARGDASIRLALALLAQAQALAAGSRADAAAEVLAEARRLAIAPAHLAAWTDAWIAEAKALRDVEKRRGGASGERLATILAAELGRPGELADRPELAGEAATLDERGLRARITWYERGLKTGTASARAGAAEGLRRALHEAVQRKLLAGAAAEPKDLARLDALDQAQAARGWATPLAHPADGLDLLTQPAFAAWRWGGEGLAGTGSSVEIPLALPACYEVACEVASMGDMPVQVRVPLDHGSGVTCDLTRSGPGIWLTHPGGATADRRRDSPHADAQRLQKGVPASLQIKVWRDGPRYAVRAVVNGQPAYDLAGSVPVDGPDNGRRQIAISNHSTGAELRLRRLSVRPLISGVVAAGAAAPSGSAATRIIDIANLARSSWDLGDRRYFNAIATYQDESGGRRIEAQAGKLGKAALILPSPPLSHATPRVMLTLVNPDANPVAVGLAVKVGAAGTWYEQPPVTIAPGQQIELAGDLRAANWTSADAAWLPMSGPDVAQPVNELILLIHNRDQPARVRLVAGRILGP